MAFDAVGVLMGSKSTFGLTETRLFTVYPAQLLSLPILAAILQPPMHWTFGVPIVLPSAVAVWYVMAFLKKSTPR